MKMNIDQLALEVAGSTNLKQQKAREVVRDIFAQIAANMEEGHEINVPNFGKFDRQDKKARQARNPRTGEMVEVPAKSVPRFRPAKQLKAKVNGEEE